MEVFKSVDLDQVPNLALIKDMLESCEQDSFIDVDFPPITRSIQDDTH